MFLISASPFFLFLPCEYGHDEVEMQQSSCYCGSTADAIEHWQKQPGVLNIVTSFGYYSSKKSKRQHIPVCLSLR